LGSGQSSARKNSVKIGSFVKLRLAAQLHKHVGTVWVGALGYEFRHRPVDCSHLGGYLRSNLIGRNGRFFIEQREKKHSKFLQHHKDIRDNALDSWLKQDLSLTGELIPYPQSSIPLYLRTATFMRFVGRVNTPEDHWFEWAFEHVKGGYKELYETFEKLKRLEDEYNAKVSKFVETTENEAKDFEFTKLASSERNSNDGIYHRHWFASYKTRVPAFILDTQSRTRTAM
jgi:hypothetical protein